MEGETSSRSAIAVDVFSIRAGDGFKRTWKDFLYSPVMSILTSYLFECSVEKILFRALFQMLTAVKLFTVNDLGARSSVPLFRKNIELYIRTKRQKRNNKT
jgi:hypothetical protein